MVKSLLLSRDSWTVRDFCLLRAEKVNWQASSPSIKDLLFVFAKSIGWVSAVVIRLASLRVNFAFGVRIPASTIWIGKSTLISFWRTKPNPEEAVFEVRSIQSM